MKTEVSHCLTVNHCQKHGTDQQWATEVWETDIRIICYHTCMTYYKLPLHFLCRFPVPFSDCVIGG